MKAVKHCIWVYFKHVFPRKNEWSGCYFVKPLVNTQIWLCTRQMLNGCIQYHYVQNHRNICNSDFLWLNTGSKATNPKEIELFAMCWQFGASYISMYSANIFFSKLTFSKYYFMNTIRVSNNLIQISLLWVQIVWKGYQQTEKWYYSIAAFVLSFEETCELFLYWCKTARI